ncbi:lipase/thioesterase [Aspergillus floccosus]
MSTSPTTLLGIEPLGLFDWLSFAWRIPLLVLRCTTYFASKCIAHREVSTLHWRQKLALAYLQASRVTFTEKQRARSRLPLTGSRIREYCRRRDWDHRTVCLDGADLDNGRDIPPPVLHFVTAPATQPDGPTILYSHGGGYHTPIRAEGHVPFVMRCAVACKAKQVVFLEYSLAPEHQYPCQLVQAVAGLRFLIDEEGISADNIILGGDSAGGHLTASLLTHISGPSPYAAPIDLGGSQFKAVFFISPWVTLPIESVLPHGEHDFLTPKMVAKFTTMFNPAVNEVWGHPCEAQDAVAVWKQLFPGEIQHATCRKAIVAVGTSEILLNSCVDFGRNFVGCEGIRVDSKADLDLVKERDFVLAIAPGEAHVQPALDSALRYYDGRMMKAILTFLETC